MKIQYISTPTGSGKTYALEQRISDLVSGDQIVVLIQPTKLVCQQTADEIRARFPKIIIELINQDTTDVKVGTYLRDYLRRPYDGGHVIIITWAAFIQFPSFDRPERFHLICDEIPQAFVSESIRVPDNHSWFTDAITTQSRGASYDLVNVKNMTIVRRVAENIKGDRVSDVFKSLAQKLYNNKYMTYVRRVAYEGLLAGSLTDCELVTFSMLSPDVFKGFRSVTMAGARAEETMLFRWFSLNGVSFIVDNDLMSKLRYQKHENGHQVDFYYAFEQNWSFSCQSEDETLRPKFEKSVVDLFGDRSFCWQDNKRNETGSPFNDMAEAHQLIHSPHGLNSFQSIDNAVLLSAMNYTSEEARFLSEFCGIGKPEQKVALAYHGAYQTYSRISIRNPMNNNRKIVVLPDRGNAEWQQKLFPGSTLQSLGIDSRTPLRIGRPRVHVDSSARKKASRDRETAKQFESLNRVIEATHTKELVFDYNDCDVSSFIDIGDYVTHLQGSIIAHKFRSESTCLISSNVDFVEMLRSFSRANISDKNESLLISPGLFLPVEGEISDRGLVNAVFGKHVYLDIENGMLKPRDVTRLFPDLEMVIYSSYSHTKLMPRYRVMFLTDNIMAPLTYKSLYHQIVQTIESAGYGVSAETNRKAHGIDYKPSVSDLFYLPSQPREGKGFFHYHVKDRKPLNVWHWIDYAIPTRFDQEDVLDRDAGSIRQAIAGDQAEICDRALQAFWDDTVMPGTGHKALNKLNFTLIQGGVDDVSRDVTLSIAAQTARSPRDRMNDKNRMMRVRQI